ncbi:MAG: GNAT family N-acetyltransferase [Pyrinomonadaceae bacterium]
MTVDTEASLNGGAPASGYAHAAYAESLAEWGSPRELRRCGGWVLERAAPGAPEARDAMGCYPLFACRDWSRLADDVEELAAGGELVSLSLVADPFGAHDPAQLRRSFPDVLVPFKEHFVVGLDREPEEFVAAHHRRNARRALESLRVEVRAGGAAELAAEWTRLYQHLVERHGIRGLTAFSGASFAKQMAVPGLTALRATLDGETVGMMLWYEDGRGVAYYHLGAYSPEGYERRASFALFWRALEHFRAAGLRWLCLGAGAGVSGGGDEEDGLSRFKRGWSTGQRTAYFCGRVFDRRRYEELARARGVDLAATAYFPAYRAGEFG